jgi:hypothetical protein
MKDVFQHCNKKHPYRYAAEFEFRYNNRMATGSNDAMRADTALEGVVGKRITWQPC